ncbi:MAG TPA: pyridoxal phosphate-dependent aminotransferase [Verrucomicrobiae bacterium]|jgi:aspartate/methionine/tyrosine aminotransferase|nr:pyridoxal phosphate-dependent aminotransferase [Verrucomicrobiae bacterium]
MISRRSTTRSRYMEWAKLHSNARFNLSGSGMASLPLAELGVTMEQLEINGVNNYGYEPMLQAIARRYRVPQECVVSAMGTSLANYLALAATTEPGDEILVEQPSYDPLLNAARYLGLEIKRFQRPAEKNFAIDIEDLERNLTSRTRLIALCNLHNPSGALATDSVLGEIATLARKNGAYVLVDEVYREMLFEPQPQTAFHIDPERFVITSSLTKAYGLGGLRCGWILAAPELAARMWHINDVHGSTYGHPTELMGAAAFEKLGRISARMKTLLETNRKLLHDFLASRDDLDCFWPEYGTVVFPRLKQGDVGDLCALLRDKFDTTVVPGSFFESPDRFRIGVGAATEPVSESLAQLGRGLDAYHDRRIGESAERQS